MTKKYQASDYYARMSELMPSLSPHIDSLTPGHKKMQCVVIGDDGPSQIGEYRISITMDIGLTLVLAEPIRNEEINSNSAHTHVEPEFFFTYSGSYKILSGLNDQDANFIILNKYDFIVPPPYNFRHFATCDDNSYLFAGIPSYRPKQFYWAPQPLIDAKGRGLVLLDDNTLIDTTRGYKIPKGAKEMPLPSEEFLKRHGVLTEAQLEENTFRYNKAKWHSFQDGFEVIYAVGPDNAKYPFQLKRRVNLNAYIFKLFTREKISLINSYGAALIMFDGEINITLHLEDDDHTILVRPGDTLVIPDGVTYDLELISKEAQYYLLISQDYSEVVPSKDKDRIAEPKGQAGAYG